MNTNKIAIIGGTGKSGKYLIDQLLKKGFSLKVLIRTPQNFSIQSSLIEVILGDVTNIENVKTLVEGCCAVISSLGLGVRHDQLSIFSKATENIIRCLNEMPCKRYIVITGINVNTPFDQKSTSTQFATDWMHKNFPVTTADKQLEYQLLAESSIDWTLVRLPMIIQTDEQFPVKVNLEDCPGEKISATDLADFLIKQLEDHNYNKKGTFYSQYLIRIAVGLFWLTAIMF